MGKSGARARPRGEIEALPSGALRVRVYAGIDPVTGKRHYLTETIPAGPKAAAAAEKARTRLLSDVDAARQPRTSATVAQLMERYLEVVDVELTTRAGYEGLIRNHIEPLLGHVQIGRLRGDTLDAFSAQLRACRRHCRTRRHGDEQGTAAERTRVDHRTHREHTCDERCTPHVCTPLGASAIRQCHIVLNSAFSYAVRWEWIGANPMAKAPIPKAPKPKPSPPPADQAAAIAAAAWAGEPGWGMLVWLAMTTGARRGELCAIRWERIDFTSGVLTIRTSIAEIGTRRWEKDTKDHQQRRIVLDAQTLALLRGLLLHREQQAAAAGIELPRDAFVFSADLDGRAFPFPATMTQRFVKMCRRLGYTTHLHQLRHYSATELISGGVDVRTVAGRLGHGSGGVTTLRFYTAWVAEADQRASHTLSTRMPELPTGLPDAGGLPALPQGGRPPFVIDPTARDSGAGDRVSVAEDLCDWSSRRIADDLRAAIRVGALAPGDPIPTEVTLADRYKVAPSTAHRARTLLAEEGLITAGRGRRAIVLGTEGVAVTGP